ncbi:MAG: thymidylate kinase [Candidatus Sungbacteria bacterium]|nr:thymidylate kinase [Candidatus Sungbacteria bacterium]
MASRNRKKDKGKLIVLEGTDGSGKGTQLKLLAARLTKKKTPVATLAFPQYGQKSAGPIEEYLNGKYGTKPGDVGPYAASLLYAIDRFDAAMKIRAWLAAGKTVVLDRYVDSNAGHQGGKIKNIAKRKKFLQWLYDIEYRILGVPMPDLVIILHVPAALNQKLVGRKTKRAYLRRGTHDLHEANLSYLKDAEQSYLWLAKTHPREHRLIECMERGRLLSPEIIHEKILSIITRAGKKKP